MVLKRLVQMLVVLGLVLSIGKVAADVKSGETTAQPKKILLLHSFGPNFQPWAAWGREIRKEVIRQSLWPLDIQEQSLVTAGVSDRAEPQFVEYLRALYAQRPPDLIIALAGC